MAARRRPDGALDLGVKSAGMSTFIFAGKFVSLAMGALMLIIIARLLGPSNYGIFTLAIATAGIVSAFGSLNIGSYFNREVPRLRAGGKEKEIGVLIGDSMLFLAMISVALMVIGMLLAGFFSSYVFGADGYELDIYVAMLSIIGGVTLPVLNAILVSVGSGTETAISFLSGTLFQTVISVALVMMGYGPLGALAGYAAGFAAGSVISLYYVARRTKLSLVFESFWTRLAEMLRFSIPVTASGVVGTLVSNFSIIILGLLLVSTSAIGQYGLATRFGWVIDVVAGSIASVLVPLFAGAMQSKRTATKLGRLYQGSLFYGLMFTMPLIVYATVLSKAIILTVFTNAYSLTILYLPLISIGILIGLLASYAFYLIVSMGRVRRALEYAILSGIMQFIAMILLGPLFHVIGIIFAYFYVGNIALAYFYVRELRSIGIRIDAKPILRVILACLIFGLCLLPLWLLQIRLLYILLLGLAVACIVYPPALVKTGALNRDEISVLYRVSREIPMAGGAFRLLLDYGRRFLSSA